MFATSDEEEEGSKQPPPTPKLDVKYNQMFTAQDATGEALISDDGSVLACVATDEK